MRNLPSTKTKSNGRPDSPAWTAAKAAGDSAEILLAEVLRGIGLAVQRLEGPAEQDLELGGRIEVKADAIASKTGNLAVEVSHAGRPSGITLRTAAACWAFVLDREIILIQRDVLRRLIDSGHYRIVPAAESNRVALIPLVELRPCCISIARRTGDRSWTSE